MSSITINGDTSGSVILQANATAGSTTLNLPTSSGTVLASVTAVAPITGTPSSSNYLRGDGTWATISTGFTGANTFTANGTFTVPAGVTKIRAQVLGPPSQVSGGVTTSFGAYISGTQGSSGGTGTASAAGGSGGSGSGGDINISGGNGGNTSQLPMVGQGGQPAYFGGQYQGPIGNVILSGCMCAGSTTGGGGAGGYAMKVISGLTPLSTIAVTVRGGICVVEW
jgi:hypothetical protein